MQAQGLERWRFRRRHAFLVERKYTAALFGGIAEKLPSGRSAPTRFTLFGAGKKHRPFRGALKRTHLWPMYGSVA
jgi:hypothetical protein